MDKSEILKKFSSDPDRYYRVGMFEERGFERRSCSACGRFFWTMSPERTECPDHSDDTYSFIGDPPTSKRFDYIQAWRNVEEFFVRNGHTSISRYPVVCRWRDDLHFTIASIVNFQRVMGSKVVFEFPANPLVVPQTCLRFRDLENVGVTGRHFSSFCMVGQHSMPDNGGYWKDRCVELDFDLVTGQFGIAREEVVFMEDVWEGGGSFGPSLEYFVRGLELGNAVFTEFQGDLGEHTVLDQRIIDMGAGLERLSWITEGTPTAYDCCFGPVTGRLFDMMGVDGDPEALGAYFTEVAKRLGTDDLNRVRGRALKMAGMDESGRGIASIEAAYMMADHLRTLIFAIADGALPSNVSGGYNLRMMLRRVRAAMDRAGIRAGMDELVDLHIDYLSGTYPELDRSRQDIKTILGIESGRYSESKVHMQKKVAKIRKWGAPTADQLITLYESDGITPEYLVEEGALSEIPSAFYARLAGLRKPARKSPTSGLPLDGLPDTEMLFYGSDPMEFEATVQRVIDAYVVLDRTSFYARGGGQEPDLGTIAGFRVVDVDKHAGVVVHRLEGGVPAEGQRVRCAVDETRRADITKNHTSTHILNASSRAVLGSWVWQHSAFKDDDHARLDITHHSPLTELQVSSIEKAANEMVLEDLPVRIELHDRGTAEKMYGFRIYQGGVVPVRSVRIVSIAGRDVEACGGTHVGRTGQIGRIRITKSKRIQDGVVRLEFVSGRAAQAHDEKEEAGKRCRLEEARRQRGVKEDRERERQEARERVPAIVDLVRRGQSGDHPGGIQIRASGTVKACVGAGGGGHFHNTLGKRLARQVPDAAYAGVFDSGGATRVVAYAGADSGCDALAVAQDMAGMLGGSAGGGPRFAQGGGRGKSKKEEVADRALERILGGTA